MQDLVSIIIVNWNGKKWLKGCLDSLYNQTYKSFEVILIDNGSVDDSVEFIENNYPSAIIIRNEKNLGFGVASNIGGRESNGNILFFLNNDTECSPDLLERLVNYKIKNNINILDPKILNLDPKILNQEGIDLLENQYLGIDYLGFPGRSRKLFYLDGCALMISKQDFLRLGGFDEKYFMYSEDIDLCWRAHLYGMKLRICEDATVLHFGGGSSERTNYREGEKHIVPIRRRYEVEKNNLRNLLKNYRFINLLWTIPLFIIQDFFESILYLITGNFKMFRTIWRAIFWNIINIKDTLIERKIIQKNRVVGDWSILKKMGYWQNKLKAFSIVGLPKFKE